MDKQIEKKVCENEPVIEKKKEKTNKIVCSVNYYKPSKNVTSVSYKIDDTIYSAFINGMYSGNITIEYTGNVFCNENIIKIK